MTSKSWADQSEEIESKPKSALESVAPWANIKKPKSSETNLNADFPELGAKEASNAGASKNLQPYAPQKETALELPKGPSMDLPSGPRKESYEDRRDFGRGRGRYREGGNEYGGNQYGVGNRSRDSNRGFQKNEGGFQKNEGGFQRNEGGFQRKENPEREQRDPIPVPEEPPFMAYVGNLPFHMDQQSVHKFFSDFGCAVKDVRLIHDRTSKFKGFGYVEFEKKHDLEKALEANDYDLGRALKVDVAEPKDSGRAAIHKPWFDKQDTPQPQQQRYNKYYKDPPEKPRPKLNIESTEGKNQETSEPKTPEPAEVYKNKANPFAGATSSQQTIEKQKEQEKKNEERMQKLLFEKNEKEEKKEKLRDSHDKNYNKTSWGRGNERERQRSSTGGYAHSRNEGFSPRIDKQEKKEISKPQTDGSTTNSQNLWNNLENDEE